MWKVQGCNRFCISRYFKIKKTLFRIILLFLLWIGCLEKQEFGKSNVGLSVHLPLRHPLPAFQSTWWWQTLCWGSWGLRNNPTQKISGKLGTGLGDGKAESTALHMGKYGTSQKFHLFLGPSCWPLTTLGGINYCPDEDVLVAKGGGMERRELGLLIWSWDQGTNGMSLRKKALITLVMEQLAFCLHREKLGIALERLCTNACCD